MRTKQVFPLNQSFRDWIPTKLRNFYTLKEETRCLSITKLQYSFATQKQDLVRTFGCFSASLCKEKLIKQSKWIGWLFYVSENKQINFAFNELKELKSTILKTFEIYQSYIFHKFVKPKNDDIKNNDQLFAFLTLMNDKWYYEQLKSVYLRTNIISKKPKVKRSVNLHEKESLFFNNEPRMLNESIVSFILCHLEFQIQYMDKIKKDSELWKNILSNQTTKFFMPDFLQEDSEDENELSLKISKLSKNWLLPVYSK